jgi:hypothetical protein
MGLGLAFIAVGVAWLIFRKWIAAYQYWIILEMLRRKQDTDADRIQALERIGILFCSLLIIGGTYLVGLHLLFRP